jgi:hypothetical protein
MLRYAWKIVKDFAEVNEELRSIAGSPIPRVEIEFLHVEPLKVFEGLTVGADGTDWNPGAGQGVYTYYAGGWNKLG